MYSKTTEPGFFIFGNTVDVQEYQNNDRYSLNEFFCTQKDFNILNVSDREVIVEFLEGILMVCVSNDEGDTIHRFVCHRVFSILPNIAYNFFAITPTSRYRIYQNKNQVSDNIILDRYYQLDEFRSTFSIDNIYAYYYNVKSPKYVFEGEKHNFYELVYVEEGQLDSYLDGRLVQTKKGELIIYGKDCFHKQINSGDVTTSFLTIMFEMSIEDDSHIINRPLVVDKNILYALNQYVKISTLAIPFLSDLMISYLKQIIIYASVSVNNEEQLPAINHHFENELLNEIIKYINTNMENLLTINDICKQFSISPSSLQNLFQSNLDTSPIKYMNDVKLSKSLVLIREAKYSISQIAKMLGFSSINYFSRRFSQKYDISPSEYAKMYFTISNK